MNEMIERVAKAIEAALADAISDCAQHGGDETGPYPSDFEAAARAAIEAMHEPTEAMVQAGCDADIPGHRIGEDTFTESIVFEADVPVIWRDMIDEALTPSRLSDI